MLIDVHAHLDFPQFDHDRNEVIERAKKGDILIINSGLGTEGIKKTLELAGRYENVLATLGMTPTELNKDEFENVAKAVRENKDKIVGIGEVGLDYYWVKDDQKRKQQEFFFRKFIELSDELDLPIVIHSRDAESDALKILKEYDKKALLHCFGGTAGQAGDAVRDGHLISIPTNVVYSEHKQEIVKAIPLEHVVLETDAPFLAPVPKTRNEPVNIRLSASKIAEINGVSVALVEKTTTENAKRFFGLD